MTTIYYIFKKQKYFRTQKKSLFQYYNIKSNSRLKISHLQELCRDMSELVAWNNYTSRRRWNNRYNFWYFFKYERLRRCER